ncbi:MAG: hypothetical protein AB1529_01600 [Candidatus Micrarchaeota archaeon]
MRARTSSASGSASLKVLVTKPEPDYIAHADSQVLSALLEKGFSYERQLCRDSMGGERPTETVRFSVSLRAGVGRMDLYLFISRNLDGTRLQDVGTHGERICAIMEGAEGERLVEIQHLKK